jgi:hypothetical protein
MRANDLTGRTFGRLRAIERAQNTPQGKATWLCECECDARVVVRATHLQSGNAQSCGCRRAETLRALSIKPVSVGERFGALLVVAREGSAPNGSALWLCRCDCGATTTIRGSNLGPGGTQSCRPCGARRGNEAARLNREVDGLYGDLA